MDIQAEKFSVTRITEEARSKTDMSVAKEFLFTIFFNGRELVTLMCSPGQLEYLAAGFLFSEGLINRKDQIKKIEIDKWLGTGKIEIEGELPGDSRFLSSRLITSGCGGGATFFDISDVAIEKVSSSMQVPAGNIFDLVRKFQHSSELYLATHGVHSAALADNTDLFILSEDVGRHNAVDKIFGRCLLENISTSDKMLVSSGRISSEIIQKVAKRGMPIVVSISPPTSLGIKAAENFGITLVGSVRGKTMNVYTNDWRVTGVGCQ